MTTSSRHRSWCILVSLESKFQSWKMKTWTMSLKNLSYPGKLYLLTLLLLMRQFKRFAHACSVHVCDYSKIRWEKKICKRNLAKCTNASYNCWRIPLQSFSILGKNKNKINTLWSCALTLVTLALLDRIPTHPKNLVPVMQSEWKSKMSLGNSISFSLPCE